MIYEHITVDMPLKKRITKYDKTHRKPYVYEILQRKTKTKSEQTTCVGIATEDGRMHPNEKYFALHPEMEQKEERSERIFDDQIHIGTSLFLRAVCQEVGLNNVLRDCFPGYDEIIKTLVEYYMVERESAAQLYKYYLYNHYTELNYIPSESAISGFFNDYLTHERIKDFLNAWIKTRLSMMPREVTIDIDFDSTNFNISSKGVVSAEYGKAKKDEGLPQVNVAYFLDRRSGLPIYYDVFYGSTIDMEHCKTAVSKLKSLKSDAKVSFVTDRGYFSQANLNFFEDNHYAYLCMGKSTAEYHRMIAVNPAYSMTKAENWIGGTIYGMKSRGIVFQESEREYYRYLYFDSGKATTELPPLLQNTEYLCECLVGKNDVKGFIRNTYKSRIDLEVDGKGIIVSAKPNYEYLNEYRNCCGYFWIISNEDLTPAEALESYRHRDQVEKSFKVIKNDSDFNKVYASSDAAFEAKSLMAFLTAILRAEITTKMRPFFIQYYNETSQTVLKEVEKIKAEEMNGKYCQRQALTAKQKQILSFFGLNGTDVKDIIDRLNLNMDITNHKRGTR